ncbi:MAG: GAF domain-containing SpoIIE family protein phosphatase [Flammeovirgaceae bacterium]
MTNHFPIQHSIKFRLIAVFTIFLLIIVSMGATSLWVENRLDKTNEISKQLTKISLLLQEAKSLEKDFTLFETINPIFYQTGNSKIVDKHQENLKQVKTQLIALQENFGHTEINIEQLLDDVQQLEVRFEQLKQLTLEKGFKDWGVIGRMRAHVHHIENTHLTINVAQMLMIRRHEKDYLLRKQPQYLEKLAKAIERFRQSISKLPNSEEKTNLMVHLAGYHTTFQQIVKLDEKIGFRQNTGIKAALSKSNEFISNNLSLLEEDVTAAMHQTRSKVSKLTFTLTIFFVILALLSAIYVYQTLGKPINKLSKAIRRSIETNFKSTFNVGNHHHKNEIGSITQDFIYLHEKVQTYTTEVLQQKEEILMQANNLSAVNTQLEEKTESIIIKNQELSDKYELIERQKRKTEEDYKNIQFLTRIGQKVSAHLEVNLIVKEVYRHIHKLMSVDVFVVGLHQQKTHTMKFFGAELDETAIITDELKLNPKTSLSAWCFKNSEEIIIHNLDEEYSLYVAEKPNVARKVASKSCVYMPLSAKKKAIGVISIQSREPQAYNDFQIDIFRNLAIYVANALENAKYYSQIEQQQRQLMDNAAQLHLANEELSQSNRTLTSSINYAKRIQSSILPKLETIQQHLPESFILFKPKDIVSGDFYFFSELPDKKLVLVAADCTGHGVPGAFTSMMGYSLLNSIINEKQLTDPKEILASLDRSISETFRQKESKNRDGMDLAIAIIDQTNKKLYFGGAKNSLYYQQAGELKIIKGSKKSVGGLSVKREHIDYETHELALDQPTTIYLASDGYQDQFGGASCKKISSRGFQDLLARHQDKPMAEQKILLEQHLHDWMEETEQKQIDDILVMGFRL